VSLSSLECVVEKMKRLGAVKVYFKLLRNNDNSKQQIYFGSSFDVLMVFPHGSLYSGGITSSGPMFKASVKLAWLDPNSDALSTAPGAQLILYPKYPEVRLSGFLRGSANAPRELMQPPTLKQRQLREGQYRCMVLGVCSDDVVMTSVYSWSDVVTLDALKLISSGDAESIAGVFYALKSAGRDSRAELLSKLKEINRLGAIAPRLYGADSRDYDAPNAPGYTLESLFGIKPNGRSDPDFMDWELKTHSSGPVTLMTPEPDQGIYKDNLELFFELYGYETDERRDFNGRHMTGVRSEKSGLTLTMVGYDAARGELVDPDGSFLLLDDVGNIAAGWSFSKLLTHWSRKHAKTAYVSYKRNSANGLVTYGPDVYLCTGTDLKLFLKALFDGVIYYDPGINMKRTVSGGWKSKKRSQFRVAFRNLDKLYESYEVLDLMF